MCGDRRLAGHRLKSIYIGQMCAQFYYMDPGHGEQVPRQMVAWEALWEDDSEEFSEFAGTRECQVLRSPGVQASTRK
uniref:Uncharacterized protein n=1 Tax=Arion vulgaris TaxID=1028688 RepID=A0A0B7ARI8_9EUPU